MIQSLTKEILNLCWVKEKLMALLRDLKLP